MNKVEKIVKIAVLLFTSFSLYAQEMENVYLIDTPKCKIGVDTNNLKNISLQECYKLKKEKKVIDNIKSDFEDEYKTRFDAYINTHNPKKDGKLFYFELDKKKYADKFTYMPKYRTVFLHKKKYHYITYKLNHDKAILVLQKYDEKIYKQRDKLINIIPRDINITKLFTPATLRHYMAKILLTDFSLKQEKNITMKDMERLQNEELSYEQMIKDYKDTKVFEKLFTSHTFLKLIPFEIKLKLLTMLKKQKKSPYLFSLYVTLSHGYRFDDPKKELELQLKAIKYLTDNYEKYREYLQVNPKDERLSPFDMESLILINLYAKGKQHEAYKKALTKLYTLAQKDIDGYSMQILITVLSDNAMQVLYPRYQKFYEQKLQENKKEVFYLSVGNWKERTHIYIKIKLLAQDTKKILKALKKDASFVKMNSKFAATFTTDMDKKEIIAKIAHKYGLSGVSFEVLDEDITIKKKKY